MKVCMTTSETQDDPSVEQIVNLMKQTREQLEALLKERGVAVGGVGFFAFALEDHVKIKCSGEHGLVISRSDSISSEEQYLVRYRAADGRAVEAWWSGNALEKAENA